MCQSEAWQTGSCSFTVLTSPPPAWQCWACRSSLHYTLLSYKCQFRKQQQWRPAGSTSPMHSGQHHTGPAQTLAWTCSVTAQPPSPPSTTTPQRATVRQGWSQFSVVAGLIWLLLAAHCGRGCAGPACRAAATGPSVGPANLPYNTSTTTHRHQWYSVTLPTLSTSLTTLQTHITYNNTHWYFLPLPTTNYVPTITIPHNITNITVHSVVLCNTTSLPEKTNHRYQCYSLKQRVRKDFKMDFLKPSLTIVTSLDRWKLLYNFTILL